jgi:hypothetical protein
MTFTGKADLLEIDFLTRSGAPIADIDSALPLALGPLIAVPHVPLWWLAYLPCLGATLAAAHRPPSGLHSAINTLGD